MSLDEKKENKEWRKHTIESELKNTYDIEIHNCMNFILVNKVNKIYECILIHDILNPPKQAKNLNSH